MAFDMTNLFTENMESTMSKGLKKMLVENVFPSLKKMGDAISRTFKKSGEKGEKSEKKKRKRIFSGILSFYGVFLQLIDAFGVLQPILSLFHGVLSIIGGTIMQVAGPALQDLAEILFGEDMMELWKILGQIFAELIIVNLKWIITILKVFAPILEKLSPVIIILIKVLGLLMIIGLYPIIGGIYIFARAIASLVDLFMAAVNFFLPWVARTNWAGEVDNFFLPILGTLNEAFDESINSFGTGGYVGPSTGGTIVRVAEGGEGEFIVPESKMGGGSQEVLWATQDNGDKLDRIVNILGNQKRLI